jgi:hypothetical protein
MFAVSDFYRDVMFMQLVILTTDFSKAFAFVYRRHWTKNENE